MGEDREGGSILLVDDQEAIRRMARRWLTRLGYQVLEAENAAAALEILEAENIALLISDIVMPGDLDGVALARVAVERWPGLKVILASGYPAGHTDSDEEAIPADFLLLSKPYRPQELGDAVQQTLGTA